MLQLLFRCVELFDVVIPFLRASLDESAFELPLDVFDEPAYLFGVGRVEVAHCLVDVPGAASHGLHLALQPFQLVAELFDFLLVVGLGEGLVYFFCFLTDTLKLIDGLLAVDVQSYFRGFVDVCHIFALSDAKIGRVCLPKKDKELPVAIVPLRTVVYTIAFECLPDDVDECYDS